MNEFLTSNDPRYRCLRTIVQGIIAAVVMYLPDLFQLNPTMAALGTALVMAVLSPIMAMLGQEDDHAV